MCIAYNYNFLKTRGFKFSTTQIWISHAKINNKASIRIFKLPSITLKYFNHSIILQFMYCPIFTCTSCFYLRVNYWFTPWTCKLLSICTLNFVFEKLSAWTNFYCKFPLPTCHLIVCQFIKKYIFLEKIKGKKKS